MRIRIRPPDQSKMKNDCSGCAFISRNSSTARAYVFPTPCLPKNAVAMTSPFSYKSLAGLETKKGNLQLLLPNKRSANRFHKNVNNLPIFIQPPFLSIAPKINLRLQCFTYRDRLESLVVCKKEGV